MWYAIYWLTDRVPSVSWVHLGASYPGGGSLNSRQQCIIGRFKSSLSFFSYIFATVSRNFKEVSNNYFFWIPWPDPLLNGHNAPSRVPLRMMPHDISGSSRSIPLKRLSASFAVNYPAAWQQPLTLSPHRHQHLIPSPSIRNFYASRHTPNNYTTNMAQRGRGNIFVRTFPTRFSQLNLLIAAIDMAQERYRHKARRQNWGIYDNPVSEGYISSFGEIMRDKIANIQ